MSLIKEVEPPNKSTRGNICVNASKNVCNNAICAILLSQSHQVPTEEERC